MADDDTAAEARRGREAAEAASAERSATEADARATNVAAGGPTAGSPAGRTSRRRSANAGADDDGPPTYALERLIADSDAFLGCQPHIAAGALSDVDEREMSVKDAKAAVKAWLKREVVTDANPAEEV